MLPPGSLALSSRVLFGREPRPFVLNQVGAHVHFRNFSVLKALNSAGRFDDVQVWLRFRRQVDPRFTDGSVGNKNSTPQAQRKLIDVDAPFFGRYIA
jgi:hypothetical protein